MSQLGEQLAAALSAREDENALRPETSPSPEAVSDSTQRVLSMVGRISRMSPEEISPTDRFVEDLYYTRLDLLELALRVEEATGMPVGDESAFTFRTPAELISAIEAHAGAQ